MRRSRRAVLSSCGVALTALAGCSALDVGDGTPDYDRDALSALGDRDVPSPPSAFPVSIPPAMYARHRDRARTLIERVPADPAIPNGVVVRRLQQDRQAVLERLRGNDHGPEDLYEGPLERIDEVRGTRSRAAAAEAAFRAATGDVSAETVADRRSALGTALHEFERDWTYRGDDPAAAIVLHRALEDLRDDVDRSRDPERAFPRDPASDVFRVGEIVRRLERGRAAMTDAAAIRRRYRDGLSDPRPLRTTMAVAGARLRDRGRFRFPRLHEYDDPDAEQLPFDRDIGDTPLERLYRETAASVERHRKDARRADRRGEPATALIEASLVLAAIETLEAVVTGIRENTLTSPGSVEDVAAVQRAAAQRLGSAWAVTPTVIATELARPAQYRFAGGIRDLRGHFEDDPPPDANDAHRAFVNFVYAARYASAVPRTVETVMETVEAVTG